LCTPDVCFKYFGMYTVQYAVRNILNFSEISRKISINFPAEISARKMEFSNIDNNSSRSVKQRPENIIMSY